MNHVRWGVIGCGDVVRKRVAAAIIQNPHSSLVAACQRNRAKLETFCQAFDVPSGFDDALQLIESPDVDAVYVATPVHLHAAFSIAASQAGKHVLVEKPMALSVLECDAMIAAAESSQVVLGVAYYRRFYPLLIRVKELIDQGAIGTVLAISAVTATPLSMEPGSEGWWRTASAESGGGPLMDIGSHRINVFQELLGEICETKCIATTVNAQYEVEDSAVLVFRFQQGAVGTLQVHFGSDDPDQFQIIGTSGSVLATPLNGSQLMITINGNQSVEHLPPEDNFCTPLINDFVQAILQRRPCRVAGDEGREVNRVIEQAYKDACDS